MQQSQPQGNNRGQIIAIIVVIVLAAAVLLPRLFNNTSTPTSTVPSIPQQSNPSSNTTGNIQIGNPVAASGIDNNGCAKGTTTSFSTNSNIYVVAPNSNVPAGTTVFARLLRDNNPIEDTSEITANQDYVNNCINFVFQPTGAPFTPGNYEAQFFINGNQGPSVQFNVQ